MAAKAGAMSSLIRLQPMRSYWTRSVVSRTVHTSLPFLIPPPPITQRLPPSSPLHSSTALLPLSLRRYISRAKRPAWGSKQEMSKKEGLGPSLRAEMFQEEMVERMAVTLFPITFVPPTGKNRPNFFKDRALWWGFTKRHMRNVIGIPVMTWWHQWKNGVTLDKSKVVKSQALALYRNMNVAIAAGDVDTLRSMCIVELFQSLDDQIKSRPKNTTMTWQFIRLIGQPKIVSDLSVPIHGKLSRQAVIKITSVQNLSVNGNLATQGRTVMEYLVLCQQDAEKGGEWRVWGTTEETTIKGLDTIERVEGMISRGEEIAA